MHRAFFIAALFASTCLAGCSPAADETASAAAPPVNAGPPGLWAVELLDASGAISKSARVCDDGSLAAPFARSLPMAGEANCTLVDKVVLTPDATTAKCKAGDTEYTATTDPQGDLTRVFTLEMAMTSAATPPSEMKQTARVRRVGECPSDWAPGDSATPGSTELTNLFTGATKTGSSVN